MTKPGPKPSLPPRACAHCGTVFQPRSDGVRQGYGRYCSRRCVGVARKGPSRCVCKACGIRFHVSPALVARGQGQYCSQAHAGQARGALEDRRFWRKVVRGTPDECWPFVGRCHPHGYGLAKHRGHGMLASRKAYILTFGPLESVQHVLHSCDWPPCCNPAHLRIGTAADNMDERTARGRQRVYPDHQQLLRGSTRWTAGAGSVLVRSFRYDRHRGVLVRYELPSGRTAWLERDVFLATFAPVPSATSDTPSSCAPPPWLTGPQAKLEQLDARMKGDC